MAATPKHKRSKARQQSARSQPKLKAKLPLLVKLASGKLVPAHTVTAANPVYKGTRFLRTNKVK